MEEEKISKEDYLKLKKSTDKTKLLIIVLFLIVIAMAAVVILLLLNKDDKSNANKENQTNNQVTNPTSQPANMAIDISIKKTVETYYLNVLLDTNGNVYLDLKDEEKEDGGTLETMLESSPTYNFNGKNRKMVKLGVQNIEELKTVDIGNGGDKYIVLLDNNNKFYGLKDLEAARGNLSLLTDEKLNNVKDVYSECEQGGCFAYAKAVIDGKEQKVALYDLFENE